MANAQDYRTYDTFSKKAIYDDSDKVIEQDIGWNENLPGDNATPLSASNLNAMLDMLISIRDKLGKTADFQTTLWESTEIKISDSSDTKTVAAYINALVAEIEDKVDGKVDAVDGKSLVDASEITKLADVSEGANKVEKSDTNGNIKIDGVEAVVYTHPEKHTISDVTGLQDALDDKQAAGNYSIEGHTHTPLEITDLDATIKGYDYATKTELGDVDKKFADYKTAADQKVVDDEQDRRLGELEDASATHATKDDLAGVDAKFAEYTKTSDLPTDLGDFTNNAGYAKTFDVNAELAKKADKSVVDAMYTNSQIDSFIAAEKERAKGIEGGLRTDVNTVLSDYLKASDKIELEGKIAAEKGRAEAAEGNLQDNITAESSRAKEVEGSLNDRLDAISIASGGFIEANSLPVTLTDVVFNRVYKIPTYRWVTYGDGNHELGNVFTLDKAVGVKVIPVDAQYVNELDEILISEYVKTPFNDTPYQDAYYYLTSASGIGEEYRIWYHLDNSWEPFDGETLADIISINDFAELGDDRYYTNYIVSYPDEYDLYCATECSDGKIFWKHIVDDNLLDLKIAEISRYDISESNKYTDSTKSQLENKLNVVSADLSSHQVFAENTYLKNDQALYGDQAVYQEQDGVYRCVSLSADDITELTILGSYNNCPVIIPAGQTSIGSFGTNTTLTKIIIKDGITDIPDYCFTNYTGLTEVILPESITSIGKYAFYKCTNLKYIKLPDAVQTIGNHAFNYCSALTEIYLPRDLTSLGTYAFANCYGCIDLILGSTEMCSTEESKLAETHRIFDYLGNQTAGVTLTIKSNVERICERFLNGNSNTEAYHPHVTSIIFEPGSKCSEIGQKAFRNNAYLTRVTIPASVTTIGDYAFSQTPNLIICCEASSKQSGWSTSWNSGTDTYYRGTSNAPGLFRSEWITGTLTVNANNTSVSFSDYPSGLPQGIYLTWADTTASSIFGIISNAGNQTSISYLGTIQCDFYNNNLTINATNISSVQVARLL